METISQVLDILEAHYGRQTAAGPDQPYEMILFVNCGYPATDASCSKGYQALKREVGTKPEEILKAPKAKVARLMRLGGIVPELRAERLRTIAKIVRQEFGSKLRVALKKLLQGEKKEAASGIGAAKNALRKFPVIGEPGADKILLFAGMAPVAAVPAAFVAVPQRILFGEENKNYTAGYRAAQEALTAKVPETFAARQRAYLLLKRHGLEVCKRAKPKCEICPVTAECAYYQKMARD